MAEVPAASPSTPTPAAETFTDLGVMPSIVEALTGHSIIHPFPIQAMALPIALTGIDMIGQARTGTGKTLAFGVTMLQRTVSPTDPEFADLDKPGAPQGLVVCPTRELASQVGKDLAMAGRLRGSRVLTVYGGVGYEPQLDALKAGVEIVVGTPGRLLDLADRRALDLSHVKVLVLDEADEMLDLGFLPDVERLLAKTPELRQTMLFSATMPSAIVSLARTHLRHPVNIRAEHAGDSTTVPTTAQFVYWAHDLDKPEVVARILQAEDRNRAMIFCRTKRAAQRVADDLAERGFRAAPIHGDLSQIAREKALRQFREGTVDVLVATDVAARGIDVSGVSHVINYECPDDEKTYVHRIGRTGRAGASGVAITFVDWADQTKWKVINNQLGLPFETPQETYSTSTHLFHDLGIDPAAKGRLVPAPPRAPKEPRSRDEGRERPRTERPVRDRQRRRTRNGVPTTDAPGATTSGGTAPSGTTSDATTSGAITPSGTTPSGSTPGATTSGATTPGATTPAAATVVTTTQAGSEGQERPRRRRRRRGRGGSDNAGDNAQAPVG